MNGGDDRSWPLEGPDDSGALDWSTGDDSVRESLVNLLLTRPGERVMRPEFGAGITRYVHQPNNQTTRGLVAGEVRRAAERGEPRIAVEAVDVDADPAEPARAVLHLRYRRLNDQGEGGLALALDFET